MRSFALFALALAATLSLASASPAVLLKTRDESCGYSTTNCASLSIANLAPILRASRR